jgi:hypothetical protein
MSSHKQRCKAAVSFEPAVLLGGAGYGAWTECDPGDPVLAHRLAEGFAQIIQIWITAPAHEREEVVDWLIGQWEAATSAARSLG